MTVFWIQRPGFYPGMSTAVAYGVIFLSVNPRTQHRCTTVPCSFLMHGMGSGSIKAEVIQIRALIQL